MIDLKERIRKAALGEGFSKAGFAPATTLPHEKKLHDWVGAGKAGEMAFMLENTGSRASPQNLLPSAQTALVVAASYAHRPLPNPAPDEGRIARYAHGPDYHPVMRAALGRVADQIPEFTNAAFESFIAVDTAPILERELAMAAGLGFIGKNNMLIIPGQGSYTLLGVLLLSLPIPPDTPGKARCGSCTICLDGCPTEAFDGPYSLDARRCISYLSIEYRGDVDEELGRRMHPWVFGCDVCQEICPYNKPPPTPTSTKPLIEPASILDHQPDLRPDLRPDLNDTQRPATSPRLADLIALKAGAYRRLVRGRALSRAPAYVFSRNASLASIGAPSPNSEIDDALNDATKHAREPARHAATTALHLRTAVANGGCETKT